jgi:cyclophilin family peptidyl-prolyl cis-trans isomerase
MVFYIRSMKTQQYFIAGLLLAATFLQACKEKEEDKSTVVPEKIEDIVKISTSYGDMYIWLYKETPKHRANFLKLTNDGFYDGTEFHRCVKDFVIQGGDPLSEDVDRTNDGTGGPGYTVEKEIDSTQFKHKFGALAAARLGDATNPQRASSGSQFYIVVDKNGEKTLDGAYTVFGEVIAGMPVATAISLVPQNSKNLPNTRVPMQVEVLKKTAAQILSEFGFVVK